MPWEQRDGEYELEEVEGGGREEREGEDRGGVRDGAEEERQKVLAERGEQPHHRERLVAGLARLHGFRYALFDEITRAPRRDELLRPCAAHEAGDACPARDTAAPLSDLLDGGARFDGRLGAREQRLDERVEHCELGVGELAGSEELGEARERGSRLGRRGRGQG